MPVTTPTGMNRRQGMRLSSSSQGTVAQSRRPTSAETTGTSGPLSGSGSTSERAKYSAPQPSRRAVSPNPACRAWLSPRAGSTCHASWYIRCIRRVRERPDRKRSSALKTPVAPPPACAKSCPTESTALPLSRNRRMSAWETTSPWLGGASVLSRSSSGIRAVKAWAPRTRARSTPCSDTKVRTHRPMNVSIRRWSSARSADIASPRSSCWPRSAGPADGPPQHRDGPPPGHHPVWTIAAEGVQDTRVSPTSCGVRARRREHGGDSGSGDPVRLVRGATMTNMQSPRADAGTSRAPAPTGWTGWVAFAGLMMIMLGTFQAVEGLVAVFDDGFYRVTSGGLVVNVDYTVWGWVHLLLGVVIVIAGIGVLTGNTAARVVGVLLAGLSALLNLAFVEAYPIWSVIVITIDVLVIYALTVHGREMRSRAF